MTTPSQERPSKPRALKPSVRRLIALRAITQRQVPRPFLANQLIKQIEEDGEIPPTLDTTMRYISKARNSRNPLDEPWTLACCSNYPQFFPPETIPIILHYKDALTQMESDPEYPYKQFFDPPLSAISIRWAIWTLRLQPLIKHLSPKLMIDDEPLPDTFPFVIAMTYAMAELASDLLREGHFDSRDLDNALFAGDTRTFMAIAAKMFFATGKPCHNNNNCDSCDYVKVPRLTGICIPKRTESSK